MNREYGHVERSYRVTRDEFEGVSIREVYMDREGTIISWTGKPVYAGYCQSEEHLLTDLSLMIQAFQKPTLNMKDLKKELEKVPSLSTRPDTEDSANPLYDR